MNKVVQDTNDDVVVGARSEIPRVGRQMNQFQKTFDFLLAEDHAFVEGVDVEQGLGYGNFFRNIIQIG